MFLFNNASIFFVNSCGDDAPHFFTVTSLSAKQCQFYAFSLHEYFLLLHKFERIFLTMISACFVVSSQAPQVECGKVVSSLLVS